MNRVVHVNWLRWLVVLCAVLFMGSSDHIQAQTNAHGAGASDGREWHQRIQRLQDISAATMNWNLALPVVQDSAVQQLLQTETYQRLSQELSTIKLKTLLNNTENKGAPDAVIEEHAALMQRLDQLQDEIRARIESNINAGYYYAAGVYIDLYEEAGGDRSVSKELRVLLSQQIQIQRAEDKSVGYISSTGF